MSSMLSLKWLTSQVVTLKTRYSQRFVRVSSVCTSLYSGFILLWQPGARFSDGLLSPQILLVTSHLGTLWSKSVYLWINVKGELKSERRKTLKKKIPNSKKILICVTMVHFSHFKNIELLYNTITIFFQLLPQPLLCNLDKLHFVQNYLNGGRETYNHRKSLEVWTIHQNSSLGSLKTQNMLHFYMHK